MNVSPEHISFAKLIDLAEDQLSESARRECFAHVNTCLSCANHLKRLRNTIRLMSTDTGEDASPDLIQNAVELFRRNRESDKSVLPQIIAVLSFDSAGAAPAYGLRSGYATTRQLIYSAEDCDLDLRVTRQNEQWLVTGQVLGKSCDGAAVELEGETALRSTLLNELCEFTLSSVPDGNYLLRLRLKNLEIEVPELNLGT